MLNSYSFNPRLNVFFYYFGINVSAFHINVLSTFFKILRKVTNFHTFSQFSKNDEKY